MLDTPIRAVIDPALDRAAAAMARRGVSAAQVTGIGLVIGLGAVASAAAGWWSAALVLWMLNRVLDGLDGPIARRSGATELGGFADFVADYLVYVGVPLAVAYQLPEHAFIVAALFGAYLINIVQLLTMSSIAERRQVASPDGRSIHFGRGLVEGTETIVAYIVVLAAPQHAGATFGVFLVLVLMTAFQRFVSAAKLLRRDPSAEGSAQGKSG